jgi:hypothetical protein
MKNITDILNGANGLILMGWEAATALMIAAAGGDPKKSLNSSKEHGNGLFTVNFEGEEFPVSLENRKFVTGWI